MNDSLGIKNVFTAISFHLNKRKSRDLIKNYSRSSLKYRLAEDNRNVSVYLPMVIKAVVRPTLLPKVNLSLTLSSEQRVCTSTSGRPSLSASSERTRRSPRRSSPSSQTSAGTASKGTSPAMLPSVPTSPASGRSPCLTTLVVLVPCLP